MSEVLRQKGPIDFMRDINREATEFDSIADEYVGDDENLFNEIQAELDVLNASNPIMGEDVIAYGDELTISMDDEGGVDSFVLPPKRGFHLPNPPSVQGLYRGLIIISATDSLTEELEHRVFHKIETGQDKYTDVLGWERLTYQNSYVAVKECYINPVEPVNAHSLLDLDDDKIVEDIDRVAFGEGSSRLQMIKELGGLASVFLNLYHHDSFRNNQRISYLNSLGILEGIDIKTDEVLMLKKDSDPLEMLMNDEEEEFPVKPLRFHIDFRYKRDDDKKEIDFLDTKGLYIMTEAHTGYIGIVPAEKVLGVEESNGNSAASFEIH